jgi:nicotinamidase/pyrazinamidase
VSNLIALIVVDLQNDFIDGTLAVPGGEEVCLDVNTYIRRRAETRFVVASKDEHISAPDHFEHYGVHCVKGTRGAQFFHAFNQNLVNEIVSKGAYDTGASAFDGITFLGRTLNDVLIAENITEIEVCGLAADVCVKATCLDGVKLGFKVTLLSGLTRAIGGDEAMQRTRTEIIEAGGKVK